MFQKQRCPQTTQPNSARRWHHRRKGMKKHRKASKERRAISNEIQHFLSQAAAPESRCFDEHRDCLEEINIAVPKKRNGSAKELRKRHPKRKTRKVPIGHSGWTTIHEPSTSLYS
jgi:hypothetical protein